MQKACESVSKTCLKVLLAPYSVIFYASRGRCGKCNRPWEHSTTSLSKFMDELFACKGHSTSYDDAHSCFPLCEDCFESLTIYERLPYYNKLVNKWQADGYSSNDERELIITAVREGK